MNIIELAKQAGFVEYELDDVPHPVDMDFGDEEKPQ